MYDITSLLRSLSTNINNIKNNIKTENAVNNLSLNSILETKILEIYNITHETSLENANLVYRNSPGIDGIDAKNKLIVQVSSTFKIDKLINTVNKLIENKDIIRFDRTFRLKFIFLGNKKKISDYQKKRIDKIINSQFKFDFDDDILDLDDFYAHHYYKQDLRKLHKVVSTLNEAFNFIPETKEFGFGSISICFDDEEISNVFFLIESLIKEGKNVYINSKLMYEKFLSKRTPLSDYIIFVDKNIDLNITNLELCIVVLSTNFINQNLAKKKLVDANCNIYKNAINHDVKTESITFDRFLKDINRIENKQLRSYQSVTTSNLVKFTKSILDNNLNESVFSSISSEEIIQELIQANNNFKFNKVHDGQDYALLSFVMEQMENLEMNYIIVKRDYNLTRLVDEYNSLHKKKYYKNLNVLVPKDFYQKTRKRLKLVSSSFPDNRVFYIDEHLYDKKYKSLEQKPLLSTKDFITPVVKEKSDLKGINDIIHWIFNNSDSSVAIVYGLGGIGKTTISEKIHDIIIEEHERNIVIFITAHQYIEVFKRNGSFSQIEYDLFSIFNKCHTHSSKIDRNSFYLNYALGNIIIIFDGIDEVISTIPTFNLHHFIDHLENLRQKIGRGKILINCRDSYINDLLLYYKKHPEESRTKSIKVFELLGFDESLSKMFFSKHFASKEKQNNCLKLLSEFYPIIENDDFNEEIKNKNYKYPPFILEIIVEIVANNFEYYTIEIDFNSKLLLQKEQNDIVIYRICNREIAKKEDFGFQLNIDKQIEFFCFLAIEEKGKIESNSIEKIVKGINILDRTEDVSNGLSDHPLLIKENNNLKFRFSFFETYFKSVFLSNLLTNNKSVKFSERLINVIAYECNINSVLFKSVQTRLSNSDIDSIALLKSIRSIFNEINFIAENEDRNKNYIYKKAISNLFLLILKFEKTNPREFKIVLQELYCSNQQDKIVSNFYLIDIPQTTDLIFDFSDFIFTKSEIINFQDFFRCKFSKDTFFDETCIIENVYNERINPKIISSTNENFDRKIKGDNSIFKTLSIKDNPNDLMIFLRLFLKSFRSKNIIVDKISTRYINTINHDFFRNDDIINALGNNNIILECNTHEIILNMEFEKKILRYINQGVPFLELNKAAREILSIK